MTDIHIPGAHRLLVADALTRAMLNRGFRIRSLDEKQAVFAKAGDEAPGAMLLGSARADSPETRVRCALIDADGGVRITARIEVVSNPGSRFEHITPPNGGVEERLVQEALAAVKDRLTRKQAPAARAPEPASAPTGPAKPDPVVRKAPAAPTKAEPTISNSAPNASQPRPVRSWEKDDDEMLEDMKRRALSR